VAGPRGVLVVGDWSAATADGMAHRDAPGRLDKVLHLLAAQHHVLVLRVDEFDTSRAGPSCGHRLRELCAADTVGARSGKAPWHVATPRQLLYCETCEKVWQRDAASAHNHFLLAAAAALGLPRPASMRRHAPEARSHVPAC
jgi:transposase